MMPSGYCMGIKIKYVSKDATREGGIFFNMREHRNRGCRNQSEGLSQILCKNRRAV